MNAAVEIRLIVTRELRKNIRSAKGIILAVLTLIVSAIAVAVCISLEATKRDQLGAVSTEAFTEAKRQLLEKATGDASLASSLATLPIALLGFLKFTVWLGPLIVALMGFDTIAGDLQHRAVRFWTVRTRRWSYFSGKFLGMWALVSIVTLSLNVISGVVVLAKGYVTAGALLHWGTWFWLTSLPITAAWTAIAIFISAQFRTPILALLTTFGVFFVLWVFGMVAWFGHVRDAIVGNIASDMSWYEYLYPNSYDAMLLSPKPAESGKAAAILFGFSTVVVALGSFSFAKKDV